MRCMVARRGEGAWILILLFVMCAQAKPPSSDFCFSFSDVVFSKGCACVVENNL